MGNAHPPHAGEVRMCVVLKFERIRRELLGVGLAVADKALEAQSRLLF